MKRTVKKLVMSREVVRVLVENELERAVGGVPQMPCSKIHSGCSTGSQGKCGTACQEV